MKRLQSLLTCALLVTGLGLTSHAANLTYQFSGVIHGGSYTPYNYFGTGSTFEATAVFDPGAAATYDGPGGWGGQQTTRPLVSLSLTVHSALNGDWTATSNHALRNVDVVNDIYADSVQFSAVGISAPLVGGLIANTFNISFSGANTLLSSTAVPESFNVSAWDPYGSATQTYLKIYLNDFSQNVTFRLTGVTASDGSITNPPNPPVASVPDVTATAPLFGLALLGAALLRRRQLRA
jgi:hypothetical protein